ncbi:DUF262 domain-containing protein [Serratia ureilytica]|uniref:DUF262 domain-containing protein n=1 Tax=Serratia ureilytica TaxID=300181 RepID=UPI003333A42C
MKNDNFALENGFRYKKLNMNPLSIFNMINHGSLELLPDFRSHSSWSITQKSRYVESVLMGIPAQEIICEENDFGELVVLDGTQRLLSLKEFSDNEFPLTSLKIMKNLSGYSFENLGYNHLSALRERYSFNFTIISYDTHPLLKFEYYKRLNTNNNRFSIQSARNYAYQNAYSILQSLRNSSDQKLGFDLHGSFARRDFLWQSKIEQFYLYIICVVLIKEGQSYLLETKMSINDLLDDTARLINDKYSDWNGIVEYISDKINNALLYFGFIDGVDIYTEKGIGIDLSYWRGVNSRKVKKFKMSMVKFMHLFIVFLDERNVVLNEFLDDSYSTPNYFDLNRSCKTLLKNIDGDYSVEKFKDREY